MPRDSQDKHALLTHSVCVCADAIASCQSLRYNTPADFGFSPIRRHVCESMTSGFIMLAYVKGQGRGDMRLDIACDARNVHLHGCSSLPCADVGHKPMPTGRLHSASREHVRTGTDRHPRVRSQIRTCIHPHATANHVVAKAS